MAATTSANKTTKRPAGRAQSAIKSTPAPTADFAKPLAFGLTVLSLTFAVLAYVQYS